MRSFLVVGVLSSCATPWLTDGPVELPARSRDAEGEARTLSESDARLTVQRTPALPASPPPAQQALPPYRQADEPGAAASVAFNAMPLPQFIDAVFGVVLKKTINIDPTIQQRRDLVSMRSGRALRPAELYDGAKAVLASYGVVIQELPGLTRFVQNTSDASSLPEIRRGRALPEVPDTARPIFYLAELENTNAQQAANWLRTTFQGKVTLQEDNARNAIMLSGAPTHVNAVLQALAVLDQPLMRGRFGARISPVYWGADDMARRISEILTAEGYYNSLQAGSNAPVIMVPVGAINALIVFANSKTLLDHIVKWVEQIDQPSQARNGNYFIYPVRHADATEIAKTLQSIMTGTSSASAGAAVAPATGGAVAPTAGGSRSRAVVDAASNSIIVQASASEYQQWFGLLKELDRPAKSALISVSVAEVTLNDTEQLGFEWFLNKLKIGGLSGTASMAGLAMPNSGLALRFYGNDTTPLVLFNALASSTRAKMLSNPTLLTRSGEEALIEVGQEVPVITSQQSNANTNTSNGGVLQTIQYRNTGVILRVRPVVHAGGRIDLDVSQEVSEAVQKVAGGQLTPTISQRRIQTKLTAMDGNTIVLGGLMKDNRNGTDSGVPWLKDLPYVGAAFRTNSASTDRTELIVLITAYSVADDFDAQAISEAFKARFPWSAPLFKKETSNSPNGGEIESESDKYRPVLENIPAE
ncbi:MAG: secretin N-terminal domain-containing protein [Rhodocyclaceae bacterium]